MNNINKFSIDKLFTIEQNKIKLNDYNLILEDNKQYIKINDVIYNLDFIVYKQTKHMFFTQNIEKMVKEYLLNLLSLKETYNLTSNYSNTININFYIKKYNINDYEIQLSLNHTTFFKLRTNKFSNINITKKFDRLYNENKSYYEKLNNNKDIYNAISKYLEIKKEVIKTELLDHNFKLYDYSISNFNNSDLRIYSTMKFYKNKLGYFIINFSFQDKEKYNIYINHNLNSILNLKEIKEVYTKILNLVSLFESLEDSLKKDFKDFIENNL